MHELIELIRAATAPDATPEQKGAGVQACRTIAAALDTEPGKPLPMPTAVPVPAISRVTIDQVLDLMIARLSVMAKTREETEAHATPVAPSAPLSLHPVLVPPARVRRQLPLREACGFLSRPAVRSRPLQRACRMLALGCALVPFPLPGTPAAFLRGSRDRRAGLDRFRDCLPWLWAKRVSSNWSLVARRRGEKVAN